MMKLDKRACRKMAFKSLSLPAGHGLLGADQIDHLIKAAEKTPRTVEGLCHLTEPLNYFCSLSYIVPRLRSCPHWMGAKFFKIFFIFWFTNRL